MTALALILIAVGTFGFYVSGDLAERYEGVAVEDLTRSTWLKLVFSFGGGALSLFTGVLIILP